VRRIPTRLDGPLLLEPELHGDSRGFFAETYRARVLAELGISHEWVQDNHSRSRRGVVRGMHFQPGMAKLIRCARGSVVDVLVDIRRGSPDFGRWEAFDIDDESLRLLYVPDGFAHGFCVTSDLADVVYKCSSYYDPEHEGGFRLDDPEVGIEWPALELLRSERDRTAPTLAEITDELPFRYERLSNPSARERSAGVSTTT
jgi:dTDP-4-dehydrorhamnose 3,5-epimerase